MVAVHNPVNAMKVKEIVGTDRKNIPVERRVAEQILQLAREEGVAAGVIVARMFEKFKNQVNSAA
jgi:hypothetical protein